MRCTRRAFVEPGMPGGEPATMTTTSPSMTRPALSSTSSTWTAISSVCRTSLTRKVSTPQVRASWLRVHWFGVKASMGMRGRTRASRRVESPLVVKVMRYFTPRSSPMSAAAAVTAPPLELGRVPSGRMRWRPWSSVFSMIRAIVRTVVNGFLPMLVSPESMSATAGDLAGALLHQRHLLQRHLHTEVATGDHDAVEGADDLVEVLDRLGLLDLGDDRQADALLVHDLMHVADVVGGADERQRDHVDAHPQRPAQVVLVLLRHRRHRHRDAGEVDALVVRQGAALEHLADDIGLGDLRRDEGELAVVDEDAVTGGHVARQARIRRADLLLVAGDVPSRDREAGAGDELDRALLEAGGADLRTLQVDEDADRPPRRVARRADVLVHPLVVGVVAVAEVQPGDVHARAHELAEVLGGRRGGAEGADDLRVTHGSSLAA